MSALTLKEIEAMECNTLSIKTASEYLGCDPQLLRDEARKNPKYLGFPIVQIGHSFKIPKEGFVNWAKGMIPVMQIVSSNELFRSFERCGVEPEAGK